MFDIGFWELLFLGIIGLLVVGPDRLPALATHTGRFIGRMKLKMRRIKAQVQQELEAEHLKSLVDQRGEELDSMRQEVAKARQEVDHVARTQRWSGFAGPHSHPPDMLQPADEQPEDPEVEDHQDRDGPGEGDTSSQHT